MIRTVGLVLAALATAAPVAAQEGIEAHVFPPDLIMQARQQIDLTAEQRAAITQVIGAFQTESLGLEWDMQDQSQGLARILEGPRVDEEAALTQVDRVLQLEREVKRAHLRMLIRIKNVLTEEQQHQLRAIARARAAQRPGPPQPDSQS